jgi:hypothetical protein
MIESQSADFMHWSSWSTMTVHDEQSNNFQIHGMNYPETVALRLSASDLVISTRKPVRSPASGDLGVQSEVWGNMKHLI